MTTYEAIMFMLTALTLMMSIISIVIKLLLYITKIMQKITTSQSFGEREVAILPIKSKTNYLLLFFFHIHYD